MIFPFLILNSSGPLGACEGRMLIFVMKEIIFLEVRFELCVINGKLIEVYGENLKQLMTNWLDLMFMKALKEV